MPHELVVFTAQQNDRARRIWFTAHVLIYLVFVIIQSALLPFDGLALVLRSLLLTTVLMHGFWLYTACFRPLFYRWVPAEVHTPSRPPLPDGQRITQRQLLYRDDFWYRWHDV